MNKEVNFEIAKLLKERGFEGAKSPLWYYKDGTLHETPTEGYKGLKCWNTWDATQGVRWDAPTITEVVMWLYEKHGMWVHCEICFDGNSFIPKITKVVENLYPYDTQFNSPTGAYEAAIIYTLENLI